MMENERRFLDRRRMAWRTIDRTKPATKDSAEPVLSESLRAKIRLFFDRYETKRAALLPALHVVQNALGHISEPAMMEIAELLDLPSGTVMSRLARGKTALRRLLSGQGVESSSDPLPSLEALDPPSPKSPKPPEDRRED